MAIRIQLKRDTRENWLSKNPVLLEGEIGIEQIDEKNVKIKFGNGKDGYISLPYFADVISYPDVINKPFINGIEINGELSLEDLSIQPSGDYSTRTELNDGLILKANADETYTKEEVDAFFGNLNKVPPLLEEDYNKYLKLNNYGDIVWSDIEGDFCTTERFETEIENYLTKEDAETNYVLKTNKENVIYGTNNSGEQNKLPYSVEATVSSVPLRNDNGNFEVNTPQSELEVANKKYVDESAVKHLVVDALPENPDPDTFYYIPE